MPDNKTLWQEGFASCKVLNYYSRLETKFSTIS